MGQYEAHMHNTQLGAIHAIEKNRTYPDTEIDYKNKFSWKERKKYFWTTSNLKRKKQRTKYTYQVWKEWGGEEMICYKPQSLSI